MADNLKFKVRHATSEDLSQLIPLLSQLTTVGYPSRSAINPTIYNNIYVLYQEDKNTIVGTITVLIEPKIIHNGGSVAHVEDVVIDQNYRKMGLGKVLLDHAISIAKKERCYKVILDCDKDNIGFYEKSSFKQKGVCMRLDLSDRLDRF